MTIAAAPDGEVGKDRHEVINEAHRMKRARMSRTFTPQRRRTWQAMASVVGQLFVRASERAERIYGAMCARGWK